MDGILTVEEATEALRALGMRISPTTLRAGLEQNRFPFGDFIKTEKSCICYIYPRLLERWIAERFGLGHDVKKANGSPGEEQP